MSMTTILAVTRPLEIHHYHGEIPVGGDGAEVSFVDDSGSTVVYKVGKTNVSPVEGLSRTKEVVGKQASISVLRASCPVLARI